jgi:predicted Zn-ribbon and HTH transcriptional regulator
MSEWLALARDIVEKAQRIREELPTCIRCGCNWPKEYLDAKKVCPNCRGEKVIDPVVGRES